MGFLQSGRSLLEPKIEQFQPQLAALGGLIRPLQHIGRVAEQGRVVSLFEALIEPVGGGAPTVEPGPRSCPHPTAKTCRHAPGQQIIAATSCGAVRTTPA